jgi:hypothetical protein
LPPNIERTYPTITHQDVLSAAEVVAGLLEQGGRAASPPIKTPIAAFVSTRLAALPQ